MFFLNAQLNRREPTMVMDHGQLIPDYENMTTRPLGTFNVQPAGGDIDHTRALSTDTEWIAIGAYDPGLDEADEINIIFNSGRHLTNLTITAPVQVWESPIGLSHVVIELKARTPTSRGQEPQR